MTAAATPTAGDASLKDIELRAWRGLLRAHASLVKRLDAELEASHGLGLSSYDVLARLAQAPETRMRMCDLADSVALSRSGLTRLVDRLEKDGLIRRACCSHDARGSFACLTTRGLQRLQEARPTHLAAVRRDFVARFDSEELEHLARLWERMA